MNTDSIFCKIYYTDITSILQKQYDNSPETLFNQAIIAWNSHATLLEHEYGHGIIRKLFVIKAISILHSDESYIDKSSKLQFLMDEFLLLKMVGVSWYPYIDDSEQTKSSAKLSIIDHILRNCGLLVTISNPRYRLANPVGILDLDLLLKISSLVSNSVNDIIPNNLTLVLCRFLISHGVDSPDLNSNIWFSNYINPSQLRYFIDVYSERPYGLSDNSIILANQKRFAYKACDVIDEIYLKLTNSSQIIVN